MGKSLYGAGAEYALHSLLLLAGQAKPVSVRDLAAYQRLPEPFLRKLLTRLKKAGLVSGSEGIAGGFTLARPAAEISFLDVVRATDPGRSLFHCAEIRRHCELYGDTAPRWAVSGTCRIHAVMLEAEASLHAFLASQSLADLRGQFQCKAPASFLEQTRSWFDHRRTHRR